MSKEIKEILKAIDWLPAGESAVLATVVDLKGSGYRLPGARMLIKRDGNAYGTISGGCLEADVMEHAKRVIDDGRAEVFTYDTTGDEDSVFSMNMGCRGVLRLLLEPVNAGSPIIRAFREVEARRCRIETATVIDTGGDPTLKTGDRMMVYEDSADNFCMPDAGLADLTALHDDLMTFSGTSSHFETISYEIGESVAELSFETLRPPLRLVILGAGADAVPLANAAALLGWQTDVYDHRPAFLTNERFPDAKLKPVSREDKTSMAADELTAIVSMNHNFERDRDLLPAALHSSAFYVGVLGPRRRTEQIMQELRAAGETFSDAELLRMRSPAGLDIGADTPETIAAAIAAEIQSVLKNRNGGPLRDRDGSIYDRE